MRCIKHFLIASLAMWANYLRLVGDGVHARELRSRALVSDNAIRSRLGALRRWRYVVVEPDHVVRLTAAGRRARAVWEPPRYVPIVGYRLFAEVVPPAEPVSPEPGGQLDLSVLLARALLGLTLEFERGSKLSLPVCANGLRVLGEDATRVRDLPRLSGVSKEGVAMLVGFLARTQLAAVEPDPAASRGKAVSLTARGLAAKRAAGRRLAEVEEGWRQRFGGEAIDGLRDILDGIRDARGGDAPLLSHGLAPYPGGWRGRRPYLTQTQAALRDPRAALPRYLMVLHRGGFPDGS